MTGPAVVVYDDRLTQYDFGPSHPLAPVRVDLTIRLARAVGVLDLPDVTMVDAPTASDDELELVHGADYIAAVKRAGSDSGRPDVRHGLGTPDDPIFFGMHEASAHVAGATLEAARRLWSGEALHAVNIAGGLHHAMAGAASGFCIYNDPAIAIAWLLAQGAHRIAYVDIDAHHGDGVQAAFYDDPRVLTVSLHESPRSLFPGTGESTETGGPAAPGSAVNIPVPAGTDDAGWLRAFHAVVPQVVDAFEPEILVSQHGCDSHAADPLTNLEVTVDGQRAAHLAIHDLAHDVCDGRWLVTGGGGYAIAEVVPRTWTHLLAVVGGRPLDPQAPVPEQWRRHALEATGRRTPERFTDGHDARYTDWSLGYDPSSWLDRSIAATQQAAFPALGLHPLV